MQLPESVTLEIDHWLTKFPADQRRSAVIAGLLKAQEHNNGWLSDEIMKAVADYLIIPAVEVFEVATFYDMFELQPIGKHKISLCTNISCMLRGSKQVEEALVEKLGVGFGETTADGQFTLRESECLGACANAPVCMVDNSCYYEDLTPEKMLVLLQELDQGVVDG